MSSSGAPAPRFRELLPALRAALWRFALAGVLPVLTFYLLFRFGGAATGIIGGMGVSLVALSVQLYRLRRVDPVVLVPMAVILVQGSAAVLAGSVELYLAAPAVENSLWGSALIGSVLIRRPLIPLIAGELGLIPSAYARSAALRGTLNYLTVAWGLAAFIKAGVRLWLLAVLPLEAFLISVTVFSVLVNGALLGLSFWWPLRVARAPAADLATQEAAG